MGQQYLDFADGFEDLPSKIDQLSTPDEIFEKCDESLLRNLLKTEDCRVEKKSTRTQPKTLGEYFCMWANTSPHGGVLVIGISNDSAFEGCASTDQNRINDIEKSGLSFCPDATFKIKRVKIHRDHDGADDFIIVFKINYHPSRVVRTTNGEVFIRYGDSKKKLNSDEIRHLQNEKGEISFETESCKLKYPDDFDVTTVKAFANTVRIKKHWDNSHSVEQILELMKLGKIDNNGFVPNVACALLFANDPRTVIPGSRIRFLRFSGEEIGTGASWNAIKDEFIDGTIPKLISEAEAIIKSQLRTFSKLNPDGRFFTTAEYPDFAWYEAIVNACVHRSYGNGMKNMQIFVKMLDDKLMIESPGAFPGHVTSENIYDTQCSRNPFLMDAMYYLEFVRIAHEGTRRIRDDMLNAQLPAPEFSQNHRDCTTVVVTLKNNIKQRKVWVDRDVVELLGAQLAHTLNENQKLCVNFLAENGKISVSDAQKLTHLSWPAARKLLGKLAEMGIVSHKHRPDKERDPAARFVLKGSKSD